MAHCPIKWPEHNDTTYEEIIGVLLFCGLRWWDVGTVWLDVLIRIFYEKKFLFRLQFQESSHLIKNNIYI